MDDQVGLDPAQVERLVVDVEHAGDRDRARVAGRGARGTIRRVAGIDLAVTRAPGAQDVRLLLRIDPAAKRGRRREVVRRAVAWDLRNDVLLLRRVSGRPRGHLVVHAEIGPGLRDRLQSGRSDLHGLRAVRDPLIGVSRGERRAARGDLARRVDHGGRLRHVHVLDAAVQIEIDAVDPFVQVLEMTDLAELAERDPVSAGRAVEDGGTASVARADRDRARTRYAAVHIAHPFDPDLPAAARVVVDVADDGRARAGRAPHGELVTRANGVLVDRERIGRGAAVESPVGADSIPAGRAGRRHQRAPPVVRSMSHRHRANDGHRGDREKQNRHAPALRGSPNVVRSGAHPFSS